jgi:formylmethanofuran dehydrogenase subunit E
VFDSRAIRARPGTVLSQDRFRKVELAVSFKRLQCHRCDLTSIYKYRVKEIRRNPVLEVPEGEELRTDHTEIWETIPRYAEIPETVKCKRCGEVLGIDTQCIF